MSRNYTRKYTLDDLFIDSNVNLPQFNKDKQKLVGKDRKTFINNLKSNKKDSLDMNGIVDMIYQLANVGAVNHYKTMSNNVNGTNITINGNLKRQHTLTMAVDDVYLSVASNKGLLKQMISNYNIINDAIELSSNLKVKPKLYLTLKTKSQLKYYSIFGSIEKGRANLITQVMENIYFNDDFKVIQEKYNIKNKRMILGTHYKNYDRQKMLWEQKVGIIKR